MAGVKIALTGVAGELQDDGNGNAAVNLPLTDTHAGFVKSLSENDAGARTGTPNVASPETDEDYRLRISADSLLDTETFNYTAQNTGKHGSAATTMTLAWQASGLLSNSASITTTTTGASFFTRAFYPMIGSAVLYCEFSLSVSVSAVPTNTIYDIGMMLIGAANPYAPTDGVYLRQNSSGWSLVRNHNGSEVTSILTGFSPTANQVYQIILDISEREVRCWIDNELWIMPVETPAAQGQPFMSGSLQFGFRHVITGGAAGGVYQVLLKDYTISKGGLATADKLSAIGNRMYGSYQGLSGGTMGTLASYANSADPNTSAALSNTAALVTGLGGQFRFNAAATAVTDGIVTSFQVPAGTANIPGRRLVVTGIKISCANLGVAVATTATTLAWSLAFGHTAVSLATAEAAGTKAARRIPLGLMTWPVGAAVGAMPQSGDIVVSFEGGPVYVNPGEFFQTVAKFIVGTATASQVIWGHATPIYGWE